MLGTDRSQEACPQTRLVERLADDDQPTFSPSLPSSLSLAPPPRRRLAGLELEGLVHCLQDVDHVGDRHGQGAFHTIDLLPLTSRLTDRILDALVPPHVFSFPLLSV